MCSPLALQLNNSDWSISPSSGSLSDDNVLSPVSENEVESVAEDVEGSNILSPVSVNGVENTVEDVEGSRTVEFSSSAIADNAADASSCNGMIVDIASNAAISQVPETNEQFEEELLADSAIHPSVENGPKVCQMIVENNHSEVVNGPTDMIHSEDDLSDIELCLESPIASPHPSNHVTDTHQTDQHNVPKLVEVIALEQKEAEIDCGVEPLSDRLTTSESSPSPVSISPPPRHIVTPAEMVDEFIASAPWKNPPTKQTSAKSKTQAEVVKHGSVIIRARGKILRKSSRKKNLTNKKLTARRRDSFQEYLEQAFDLKPFMIRLDRHRNESEINESEKLHFLSNFHLKKKSVFPLYSEHQKKRAEFNSPRRKPPLKAKRSKNKKEGTTKPNAVARKRTTPKPDLSRYSRCIQGVIIERWDENAYRRPIEIHDEHSYNFRENENERRLSTDFSLRV